jgi:hypothetical protein
MMAFVVTGELNTRKPEHYAPALLLNHGGSCYQRKPNVTGIVPTVPVPMLVGVLVGASTHK